MQFRLRNFILLYNEIGSNEYKELILHSLHVAKLSSLIARELNFTNHENIYVVGMLHDVGFITLNELLRLVDYLTKYENLLEIKRLENLETHPKISSHLLKVTGLFSSEEVEGIKYHHSDFSDETGERFIGSILRIADTVSWFFFRIKKFEDYASIIPQIWETLEKKKMPERLKRVTVDILKDYTIIDKLMDNKPHFEIFGDFYRLLSVEEWLNLVKIMAFIQEVRSPTTKDHLFLVSKVSQKLGETMLGKADGVFLRMAGYLHDLGKLKTPLKILHKTGSLTEVERILIKKHVFDTIDMLSNAELVELADLCGAHHERLDGSGYPFGLTEKELNVYKRVLAVADYYSALIEPRPYRESLHFKRALSILQEEVQKGKIDGKIYNELKDIVENDEVIQKACHEYVLEDIFDSDINEIRDIVWKFMA